MLIGFLAFFMQRAVNECLGDPLLYGAGKLSKANNAEFSCTCGLNKPNSPIIIFDSKNMSVEFPTNINQDPNLFKIDFNKIGEPDVN